VNISSLPDAVQDGSVGVSLPRNEPVQSGREPEQKPQRRWQPFVAGLGLTILIGGFATLIAPWPILTIMGSLTVALLIGLLWRNVAGLPTSYADGVKFSAQKLLRYGIILTGVRLNFTLIASSGLKVLVLDAILIAFGVTVVPWLARKMGLSSRLAFLMGVGQSICGASAVGAMEAILPAGDDNDDGPLAVAICGVVGTLGVLFYTFGMQLFHWTPTVYGLLTGSTLHEIAQVLAAAPVGGKTAADLAMVVKLTRVVFLAPVAFIVAFVVSYREGKRSSAQGGEVRFNWKKVPVPWFVFGFLLVGVLNSIGLFSQPVANFILQVSTFLMVAAMAGMGLNVDIAVIRKTGLRAMCVSIGVLALFIALSSILLVVLGKFF
jgi:Predicted membrane protein